MLPRFAITKLLLLGVADGRLEMIGEVEINQSAGGRTIEHIDHGATKALCETGRDGIPNLAVSGG